MGGEIRKFYHRLYVDNNDRRGLPNKIILHAKQGEWIICSPKSIVLFFPPL